jgi:hypothetical protein
MTTQKPYIMGGQWLELMSSVIDPTKPVRVYRNLHRNCLSIKQGVVRCHAPYVFLRDVKFLVNEKIRDRVRETRQKQVHAYVMGYLESPIVIGDAVPVSNIFYNPYKNDSFVIDNGERIDYTSYCEIDHDGNHVSIWSW